jgi:hypothetical protein
MNTIDLQKQEGQKLHATEWNQLVDKTNELVNAVNNGGAEGTVSKAVFVDTEDGIEAQYKLTADGERKTGGTLKLVAINEHASQNLVVDGKVIAPGQTRVLAECNISDLVKLVKNMGTFDFELVYPPINKTA